MVEITNIESVVSRFECYVHEGSPSIVQVTALDCRVEALRGTFQSVDCCPIFALTDGMLDCVRTSRGTVDDGVGGISVSLIERRSGLDQGLAKCSAIKVNESDLSLLGMVSLPIENSVQVRGIDPKYDQEGNPYPGFSGITGCLEQTTFTHPRESASILPPCQGQWALRLSVPFHLQRCYRPSFASQRLHCSESAYPLWIKLRDLRLLVNLWDNGSV